MRRAAAPQAGRMLRVLLVRVASLSAGAAGARGLIFRRRVLSRRAKNGRQEKIEIFTAGCPACSEAVELVKRIAGSVHDVEILDMHQADVAARARGHGIRSLPSVMVDGRLAGCCAGRGPDEAILRQAIG